MKTSDPLARIGFGLAAGLIGTLVMTLGQKAEIAITDRDESLTPAKAAEQVTGVKVDGAAEQTLSTATHLAFGTALGAGLAALDRVPEPLRTLAFFAGAWGIGTGIITAMKLADPPTEWDAPQLATDLGHHAVYAISAAAAYAGMTALADRASGDPATA